MTRALASCIFCFVLWTTITTAAMASVRTEQVSISAADVTLRGTLHIPLGASGPRPAVVLLSGSRDSRNLPGLAEHLAARGIVVLDLAKRGVDGSQGSWRTDTIERRAADALAAIAFLRARPGVHPEKVGLVGHSQGGWVGQLAAARSPDVHFLVLLAGPAQTVRQQILTDERIHLSRWGVPAAQVAERIEMLDQMLTAGLTNPAVCGEQAGHPLCGIIHYDPAPALSAIDVPVLAFFGEHDPMVPPEENLALLERALPEPARARLTTRVFPSANHVFWRSTTGLRDEYEHLDGTYLPGFLEGISEWILRASDRG